MAKCVVALVCVFSLFTVISCLLLSSPDDAHYYHYKTSDANVDLLPIPVVLLRERRDVAASVEEVAPKPVDTETNITHSSEKKETNTSNKVEVDKFPDTKKPQTNLYGTSKLDKYEKPDKKKKPSSKPGEKPTLKPETGKDSTINDTDTALEVVENTTNTGIEVSTTSSAQSTTTTTSAGSNSSWPGGVVSTANNSNGHLTSIDVSVDDDIAIEDDSPFNMTDYQNNITKTDHHKYYTSFTYSGQEVMDHFWVKLEQLPESFIKESKLLSSSHRQAFTLSLPFEFPFYGHIVRNITIATGGFLFTGELLHSWLAATQYIAPLMANFDTSASNESKVKYAENGTALTVQWENVKLREKLDGGAFTFQVTIHSNGDIVFSYKDVPVPVDHIADDQHPVKVGLSDAYIVHKAVFYMRRKTIYEYHKINMKKPEKISNWTAILFKALPTCISIPDCHSCVTQNSSFQCRWCEKVGRCSDGLDRHRQDWLLSRCDFFNTDHLDLCKANVAQVEGGVLSPSTQPITAAPQLEGDGKVTAELQEEVVVSDDSKKASEGSSSVGAGLTVAILVCLLLCVVGWVAYAYFFPHTTSGQLLIKYRPSTWSFKRGGARYTAASMHSIHM